MITAYLLIGYLLIGGIFATSVIAFGDRTEPMTFGDGVLLFVFCQLGWPMGLLILLILATDGVFDR